VAVGLRVSLVVKESPFCLLSFLLSVNACATTKAGVLWRCTPSVPPLPPLNASADWHELNGCVPACLQGDCADMAGAVILSPSADSLCASCCAHRYPNSALLNSVLPASVMQNCADIEIVKA
jgi:hypothetical protein